MIDRDEEAPADVACEADDARGRRSDERAGRRGDVDAPVSGAVGRARGVESADDRARSRATSTTRWPSRCAARKRQDYGERRGRRRVRFMRRTLGRRRSAAP